MSSSADDDTEDDVEFVSVSRCEFTKVLFKVN